MEHVLGINDVMHTQVIWQGRPIFQTSMDVDIRALPWRDACFDLVLCRMLRNKMPTHDERVTCLARLVRILVLDGRILISLPVDMADIIDAEAMVNDVPQLTMVRIHQAGTYIHLEARRNR